MVRFRGWCVAAALLLAGCSYDSIAIAPGTVGDGGGQDSALGGSDAAASADAGGTDSSVGCPSNVTLLMDDFDTMPFIPFDAPGNPDWQEDVITGPGFWDRSFMFEGPAHSGGFYALGCPESMDPSTFEDLALVSRALAVPAGCTSLVLSVAHINFGLESIGQGEIFAVEVSADGMTWTSVIPLTFDDGLDIDPGFQAPGDWDTTTTMVPTSSPDTRIRFRIWAGFQNDCVGVDTFRIATP